VSAWTTLLSWARRIYAVSCDPMLANTTTSERIGRWIRMRRSLARFSRQDASNRIPSLADFIATMVGFRVFGTHKPIEEASAAFKQV